MNFAICISAIVYVCIAICVFWFAYSVNEDLKQRKHYEAHPERYGVAPVWIIALVALLWPLQIVCIIICICGGFRR